MGKHSSKQHNTEHGSTHHCTYSVTIMSHIWQNSATPQNLNKYGNDQIVFLLPFLSVPEMKVSLSKHFKIFSNELPVQYSSKLGTDLWMPLCNIILNKHKQTNNKTVHCQTA